MKKFVLLAALGGCTDVEPPEVPDVYHPNSNPVCVSVFQTYSIQERVLEGVRVCIDGNCGEGKDDGMLTIQSLEGGCSIGGGETVAFADSFFDPDHPFNTDGPFRFLAVSRPEREELVCDDGELQGSVSMYDDGSCVVSGERFLSDQSGFCQRTLNGSLMEILKICENAELVRSLSEMFYYTDWVSNLRNVWNQQDSLPDDFKMHTENDGANIEVLQVTAEGRTVSIKYIFYPGNDEYIPDALEISVIEGHSRRTFAIWSPGFSGDQRNWRMVVDGDEQIIEGHNVITIIMERGLIFSNPPSR
ncbi:hypothetical protein KA119_02490 [Candidatus Gracilibacteria bacterium]|nr:hypothetical protein [Candidatus Gracilibacteria bacterium]